MRELIILRGPENSGQRDFISRQGLDHWVIDQDALEQMFGEVVPSVSGKLTADPFHRTHARRRILSLLQDKFSRGSFVVFLARDTGVPGGSDEISIADKFIAEAIAAAQARRYRVTCVDFCSLAPRNTNSEKRIARYLERRNGLNSPGLSWLDAATYDGHLVRDLEPTPIDLDAWQNLVIIGDIHGFLSTFRRLTGGGGPDPNTAYVFLGDYINKGPDSGSLLRHLMEKFSPHPGTVFLTGNHERSLEDWALGADPVRSRSFVRSTQPSFEACGFTRDDARAFLDITRDAARIQWGGRVILATHGGLTRPPNALCTLSAEHLRNGTGPEDFDVDQSWEDGVYSGSCPDPRDLIQVHGHRNSHHHPINAGIGSYNLENGVDCGGYLRALVMTRGPQGETAPPRGLEIPSPKIACSA